MQPNKALEKQLVGRDGLFLGSSLGVELRVEAVGADVMLVWCGMQTKMALYPFMLGTR